MNRNATHLARAVAHVHDALEALDRTKEALEEAGRLTDADTLRALRTEVQRLSDSLSGSGDPLSYGRMLPPVVDVPMLVHLPRPTQSAGELRLLLDKIRARPLPIVLLSTPSTVPLPPPDETPIDPLWPEPRVPSRKDP